MAILHSSNEPGELSQWLCHDDSTINIVLDIIIIIILFLSHFFYFYYYYYYYLCACALLTAARTSSDTVPPNPSLSSSYRSDPNLAYFVIFNSGMYDELLF